MNKLSHLPRAKAHLARVKRAAAMAPLGLGGAGQSPDPGGFSTPGQIATSMDNAPGGSLPDPAGMAMPPPGMPQGGLPPPRPENMPPPPPPPPPPPGQQPPPQPQQPAQPPQQGQAPPAPPAAPAAPPPPPQLPKQASLHKLAQSPFVAAFLDGCQRKGIYGRNMVLAINKAAAFHPEIHTEFEKAGFYSGIGRDALNLGGGLIGGLAGLIPGIPAGPAAFATSTAGGLAGSELGEWAGNKIWGDRPEGEGYLGSMADLFKSKPAPEQAQTAQTGVAPPAGTTEEAVPQAANMGEMDDDNSPAPASPPPVPAPKLAGYRGPTLMGPGRLMEKQAIPGASLMAKLLIGLGRSFGSKGMMRSGLRMATGAARAAAPAATAAPLQALKAGVPVMGKGGIPLVVQGTGKGLAGGQAYGTVRQGLKGWTPWLAQKAGQGAMGLGSAGLSSALMIGPMMAMQHFQESGQRKDMEAQAKTQADELGRHTNLAAAASSGDPIAFQQALNQHPNLDASARSAMMQMFNNPELRSTLTSQEGVGRLVQQAGQFARAPGMNQGRMYTTLLNQVQPGLGMQMGQPPPDMGQPPQGMPPPPQGMPEPPGGDTKLASHLNKLAQVTKWRVKQALPLQYNPDAPARSMAYNPTIEHPGHLADVISVPDNRLVRNTLSRGGNTGEAVPRPVTPIAPPPVAPEVLAQMGRAPAPAEPKAEPKGGTTRGNSGDKFDKKPTGTSGANKPATPTRGPSGQSSTAKTTAPAGGFKGFAKSPIGMGLGTAAAGVGTGMLAHWLRGKYGEKASAYHGPILLIKQAIPIDLGEGMAMPPESDVSGVREEETAGRPVQAPAAAKPTTMKGEAHRVRRPPKVKSPSRWKSVGGNIMRSPALRTAGLPLLGAAAALGTEHLVNYLRSDKEASYRGPLLLMKWAWEPMYGAPPTAGNMPGAPPMAGNLPGAPVNLGAKSQIPVSPIAPPTVETMPGAPPVPGVTPAAVSGPTQSTGAANVTKTIKGKLRAGKPGGIGWGKGLGLTALGAGSALGMQYLLRKWLGKESGYHGPLLRVKQAMPIHAAAPVPGPVPAAPPGLWSRMKASPTARFAGINALGMGTGVASGLLANWLYEKLSKKDGAIGTMGAAGIGGAAGPIGSEILRTADKQASYRRGPILMRKQALAGLADYAGAVTGAASGLPGAASGLTDQAGGLLGNMGKGIGEVWGGLEPHHKASLGLGAGLLGYSAFNKMTGMGPDIGMWGPILGGAAGLYGLSGGDYQKLLPNMGKLFGVGVDKQPATIGSAGFGPANRVPDQAKKGLGVPAPKPEVLGGKPGSPQPTGLSLQEAAKHPQISKYFNPDGTPKVQDVIGASDNDLTSGFKLLSPEAKQQLRGQVQGFQPSFMQRMGAKTMGIDIDAQRQRFSDLMSKAGRARALRKHAVSGMRANLSSGLNQGLGYAQGAGRSLSNRYIPPGAMERIGRGGDGILGKLKSMFGMDPSAGPKLKGRKAGYGHTEKFLKNVDEAKGALGGLTGIGIDKWNPALGDATLGAGALGLAAVPAGAYALGSHLAKDSPAVE